MSEVNVLKRFFELKSIQVSTYWIECCLEWFKENNRNYTEALMCQEVFGQWLETDLRDIEFASLPKDITKHRKHILNGNYSLQIMYIKDISRSAYSQLKTIRDLHKLTRGEVDAEYTLTSGEGKRLLYLYITDGVQHINAFEYEQIPSLNTTIQPGTKLLLIGPLSIRNGEILLKENNVRILGGRVEELLICNAYENILARELNMPENPTPGQLFQGEHEIIPNNINNIYTNDITHKNTQPPSEAAENFDNDNDDIFNNINLSEHFSENQDSIHINDIEESERRALLDNDDDIIITDQIETDEINFNLNSSFIINNDIEPFVYIKYLLENRNQLLNKTYKVKAQFLRVVEKLNVSKIKGWTMKFVILDGTGSITVDFLSSVIEKLMDLSPNEAIAENLKVKNRISKSHEKVSDALKNCKKKLDSFEYIMQLQFNNIDTPTVISLETITKNHLVQLQNRVENTQLQIL